jgi:hypothetical protein
MSTPTLTEAPVTAAPRKPAKRNPNPRRTGVPADGAKTGISQQASVYFAIGQLERLKILSERTGESRNAIMQRAVTRLREKHGDDDAPPVPPLLSGGRETMRQWIPGPGQETDLDVMRDRWGLPSNGGSAEVLRIAAEVELRRARITLPAADLRRLHEGYFFGQLDSMDRRRWGTEKQVAALTRDVNIVRVSRGHAPMDAVVIDAARVVSGGGDTQHATWGQFARYLAGLALQARAELGDLPVALRVSLSGRAHQLRAEAAGLLAIADAVDPQSDGQDEES